MAARFNKLWVFAEILLFVLVGAEVSLESAADIWLPVLGVIFGALAFRFVGVFLCMIGTKLNMRERLFCMIAYMPKATVQAAIGGVPLAMGLSCGDTILAGAVVAILVTATLGAFLIDLTANRLLKGEGDSEFRMRYS